jgi:hypothetical protein
MRQTLQAATLAILVSASSAACCRGASAGPGGGGAAGSAPEKPGLSIPKILGGGAKDFPAPSSFAAPPLVEGSSSRMRLTKGGKPDGEQLIKVLAVTGDQVRVEIAATSPKTGETIVQALLRLRDRRLPSGIEILEAHLKRAGGAPMKLSGAQLKASQALLGNQFDVFAFPDATQNPQREDVTVPAGVFKGCLVADREGTIRLPALGVRKTRTRTWYHPAVTTNGIVKQESTTDGEKQISELVEMASSGAKSAL